MVNKNIVYFNCEFIPAPELKISFDDSGLLNNYGLFETMRSFKGRIVYFNAHLERLKESCRATAPEYDFDARVIKRIVSQVIEKNYSPDLAVRLVLWKTNSGVKILVSAENYIALPSAKYKQGFSATTASLRQNDSLLARIKTTNRVLFQLSIEEARKNGFDESIILNSRGFIAEATRSNIFFVYQNALFTPSLACGCLEGVTRKVVFDFAREEGLEIYQGNYVPKDLIGADEAFLSGSLKGIMPLSRVDKNRIGRNSNRKITYKLMKKYNLLQRNETNKNKVTVFFK